MSPVYPRDLGVPRNQPEERMGLFRSIISGSGQHGKWKETQGNHAHTLVHFPIQQTCQTRGIDRYGSSTSAPPTPQRLVPMKHRKQEIQPGFKLGRAWGKLPEDMCQRDILP
ncbi:hypothetical protein O181_005181 [Austropuccinia psidii MF-1]|uniref:Uncharacterized protein n=1 Tax=Austropuccinia psidii MF-1 TaxID=1389203 RepID=A0A9Q3BGU4_9BASI|nr:hypothetical protein [Austropuccinia psidii MF-1]